VWLQVRTGPDAGTAVELPDDARFVLGRQRGCDLIVRDERASRRHAELTPDGGGRWRLEDLGSANGTFVAGAVDPLPTTPIEVGVKHEVGADDRIYLGSWTRLVIRKAAPGEVT